MRRLVLLLALLLTVPALLGGGPGDPRFSDRIQAELDATIRARVAELGIPAATVGLWVPGVGEFVRTYGESDPDTGRARSLADSQRIGSVTKTFTTQLILQLADDGLLSLDDPVSKFFSTDGRPGTVRLSQPIPNGDQITLRNLGRMTSGLASYTFVESFQEAIFTNPSLQVTPVELVEIGLTETAAGCPAAPPACFAPGTSFFYSNTNTVLLGLVAETVTGKPVATLLRERITGPLRMTTTGVGQSQMPVPFGRGFTFQGIPEGVLKDATNWNPSWGSTAGDMVSTLEDLRIWARVLATGEGLSPAARQERLAQDTVGPNQPNVRAYAFGIGNTEGWWGHTGELPGYNTVVYYRTDIQATMIVMTTIDTVPGKGDAASVIARDIVRIAAREAPLGELNPVDYPVLNR